MKKTLCLIMICLMAVMLFAACGGSQEPQEAEEGGIDYMALVNKEYPLPDGWEDAIETVHYTNSVGDDVEVEKKAWDAYEQMKADLEKMDIHVDLDSARRTIAAQQKIVDDFTEKYGADYVKRYVAVPGYSEHHTGLALDLYLNVDGVDMYENEEMIQYPEIWEQIHAKLADYGFILRYLEGKEAITGYGYEPWHIRYIDNVDVAKEIMEKAQELGVNVSLSVQTRVTQEFANDTPEMVVPSHKIPDGWEGLDCGPASIENWARIILASKTILWNGPAGVFEFPNFATGTEKIAELVAKATEHGAYTLVGGGDSVAAVTKMGFADKVSYVSTGGGAMLEAIEGKTLPGIAAIQE